MKVYSANRIVLLPLYVVLIFSCLLPSQLSATSWGSDPTQNTPICTNPVQHERPQIISDGLGGVIITWTDLRDPESWVDIFAQRVDANGYILWAVDGIPVCTALETQQWPEPVPDGSNGAIIAWDDFRNGADSDIYAQRIDELGNILWDSNGVAICIAPNDQFGVQICSDSSGGAIITWLDSRDFGTNSHDIYAQRIDPDGNILWASNGVTICIASGAQDNPLIVSDNSHGAIIAWHDSRDASTTSDDIYAQRIDKDGIVLWTTNGFPVCTDSSSQTQPAIAADSDGGVIIAWSDDREGGPYFDDVYAQRIDSLGSPLWTANGLAICSASDDQGFSKVSKANSYNAIICWTDGRNGASDIYAQQIDDSGSPVWTVNGVAICTDPGTQDAPRIISDSSRGAIIAWEDYRTGLITPDIYANRIDMNGNVLWTPNGSPISTAPYAQYWPELVPDGMGGAIITWEDWRQGGYEGFYYIYAQRVDSTGSLGPPTAITDFAPSIYFSLSQNYPNPFSSRTTINYYTDTSLPTTFTIYNVLGHQITQSTILFPDIGTNSIFWDGSNNAGVPANSGIYFYRIEIGGNSQTRKMLLLR